MKITGKLISLIIISVVILGLVTIIVSASSMIKKGRKELDETKNLLVDQRKKMLSNLVSNAYTVIERNYEDAHDPEKLAEISRKQLHIAVDLAYHSIEHIHKSANHLSEAEKKRAALELIRTMRYDDTGYFWINDEHPTMIMHPFRPELNGKDISDFRDPDGKNIFVEMTNICQKNGEGVMAYRWPMPGHDKPVQKLSYVRMFKPWGWIIGTGVYIKAAEHEMKEKVKHIICSLHYGDNHEEYFYIFGADSKKMLQHPEKSLVGTDIRSDLYKDPDGKLLLMEQLKVALKRGEGFVSYKWPKMGQDKPVPKLTFVKLFRPWNWVVCTGTYLDDLEKMVAEKEQKINAGITEQIWSLIISVSIVGIATIIGIVLLSTRYVTRPVKNATRTLRHGAEQVYSVSRKVFSASQSMTRDTSQQAASVMETTACLEQVASIARQNADHANQANAMMEQGSRIVEQVNTHIMDMGESMNAIILSGREISNIIETIDEIAFQTNLLALNAAVEAARAGEAGAGFAVVANEVRTLALRSAHAAMNTSDMIESAIRAVNKGNELTRLTQTAYRKNVEIANKVSDLVKDMALSSENQAQQIGNVSIAMADMNTLIQHNAANAEASVVISEKMNLQAEMMKSIVENLEAIIGRERSPAQTGTNSSQ